MNTMNTTDIDISKLDKAEVLAALYNNSRQQGMGFLQSRGREGMTVEQAREEIVAASGINRRGELTICFDYLNGRVMKVDIGGDTLAPHLYDRDNGQGAAAAALEPLLATTT
jgi:hypothetical protein